jgi:hypothetical protein
LKLVELPGKAAKQGCRASSRKAAGQARARLPGKHAIGCQASARKAYGRRQQSQVNNFAAFRKKINYNFFKRSENCTF